MALGGIIDETKAVRNDKGVTRKFVPYLQPTVTLQINRGDSSIRRNRNDRLADNARFVIAIQVGVDDSVAYFRVSLELRLPP